MVRRSGGAGTGVGMGDGISVGKTNWTTFVRSDGDRVELATAPFSDGGAAWGPLIESGVGSRAGLVGVAGGLVDTRTPH